MPIEYYFFYDPTRYLNLLLLEFGIYQSALQVSLALPLTVTLTLTLTLTLPLTLTPTPTLTLTLTLQGLAGDLDALSAAVGVTVEGATAPTVSQVLPTRARDGVWARDRDRFN